MFVKQFLAGTALVACASAALALERGVPSKLIHPRFAPERPSATLPIGKSAIHGGVAHNGSHFEPHAIFNNFSKDKNAEFISWYGFTAEYSTSSYYASRDYHYKFSEFGLNALPFLGTGKAPKSLTIPGFSKDPSNYKFEGAILSSLDGLPGRIIATTSSTTFGDATLCCTAVRTVNFADAPKLAKGEEYFVAVECANAPCIGGWNMEDTDISGATVDYWLFSQREIYNFGTSCPSGTGCHDHTFTNSPSWRASTYYPEAGAVIIK